MGNIDQEGFLSEDINKFEKHNNLKYEALFNYYRELNSFCQEYAFKLSIPKASIRKLVLTILFLRSLSTFQSVFILLTKGIIDESKVLLRTQFEIVFQLVAIVKNEHYEKNYLGQEFIQRKKLLNKANAWGEEIKNKLPASEVTEMLRDVLEEIQKGNIKEVKVWQYADKAELMNYYSTAYTMLCQASHANVMDLKSHFIFDKDGLVSSFKWGPCDNKIFDLTATSIENQLLVLKNLELEFYTKLDNKINTLREKFYVLIEERKIQRP